VTWFKVDDRFYSHPKVLATSLAARGLWVGAGAWSSDHLTGGAVPDHALGLLGGSPELADELVTAGLWKRTRGGYRFHDWDRYQPDATEEKGRKSIAGQVGNHRRWHTNKGVVDPKCAYCQEEQGIAGGSHLRSPPDRSTESLRNRPVPGPGPSLVSVGNQSAGRNARGDPEIDEILKMIIETLYDQTDHVVSASWAVKVRDTILTGQPVDDPVAYVKAAIENEPDPKTRFLEHYGGIA